ncbi:MAG TPA: hypothetical protein VMS32_04750 [Verrucomicrobiae bacterium]|jgi:uncharacterized repeat protein (TIGR01451 family)|nr:hypothetical protein [Verrucomicrobiae bacterium]
MRVLLVVAVLLGLWTQGRGDAALPGGTQIANSVSATYQDASAHTYAVTSNVIVATIANIAAIVVTPKQLTVNPTNDGIAVGTNATRTFVITNDSNISDAYKITSLTVAPMTVVSLNYLTVGGPVPVTVGTTVSPTIAPGGSIQLQVVLSTTSLHVGQSASVSVTAQTTVTNVQNGLQSDSGEQWVLIATAPSLTGNGPNSAITKTVDHVEMVQSQPGAIVTFDIVVKNAGGAPATNVVITDTIETGLNVDLSTVAINGTLVGSEATLVGQVLTIQGGTMGAGASWDLSFNASTANAQILGATFTNVASVSADGVPAQNTTPAAVLIGSANIVFDGYAGASHPVANAVVTLLDSNNQPVVLTAGGQSAGTRAATSATRAPLNSNTANPFTTGGTGSYGFNLQPSQIAAGGSRFYLTIQAPDYLNRKIQLDITPGLQNLLYNVTMTSLDGQPVAVAGGFTLTTTSVKLANVFGLFGNLPLFAQRIINVSKTADRSTAQPGDRVKYTIDFSNASSQDVGPTEVVDTLPAGEVYAPGSGQVDGVATEPTISGRTLTWSFPTLPAGATHAITYYAIIYPTVAAGTNLVNGVTVSGTIPTTHVHASGTSSVTVQVITGAFTQRRVITGRVFYDYQHTGRFVRGDKGIPAVRIYLEDGSSVVTDPQGRYSFPSVRPGMHVLRLDITTLPKDAQPSPIQRMNSTYGMQRLVHGVFDDGLMDDVEFALVSL